MKISLSLTSLLLLLCLSAAPILAESSVGDRSYCNTGSAISPGLQQLSDWFKSVELRIKSHPGSESLYAKMKSHLHDKQLLVCRFRLTDTGSVEKESVYQNQSTFDFKPEVLKLIRDSAPYQIPPNDLPRTHGVVVRFSKEKEAIKTVVDLDMHVLKRIGQD